MKLKNFTIIVMLFASLQLGKATCTSAPTNLSVVQNGAQMSFLWNDVAATSYIIEIRDPQYNTPWSDPDAVYRDTLNATTHDFPFSIQGYSLEWRVRAVCPAGELISASQLFTSDCASAASIQAQDIGFDTVRLSWTFNGIVGEEYGWSVGYRVLGSSAWIPLQFNSGGYLSSITVNNFATLRGLTPGTTYEWCVNQNCNYTGTISNPVISQFTTLVPSCPAPVSYPASNITLNSAVLNWQALPQATGYFVQWFINNSPVPSGTATVSNNSYLLTGLQPGNGVLYRVSAICPYVSGYNFSTFASFETPTGPPPPVSSYFIDYFKVGSIERVSGAEPGGYINTGLSTQVVRGQRYQFRVSMGSTGAYVKQNYAFYLDMNGNGNLEINERLFGVGAAFNANTITLNLTIPATATPGQAQLRVIMKTANGGIQPSISPGPGVEIEDYWLDILPSASSSRPVISSEFLKSENIVFENPSNGLLSIRNMSDVSQLRIMNQVGQLIMQKSYAVSEESDMIDLTSQTNGIYYMEFTDTNGIRKTEKIIIQH
ncbi:MAG: hypothetical protein RIR48_3218 [Bacteroidota bacterium]